MVAGASVAIANLAVYSLLLKLSITYTIANICALVLSKIFGYFMNKLFVYHSHTDNMVATLKELLRFVIARGFTGVIDFLGLIALVELIRMNEFVAKCIIIFIVIILNYILGKKAVFRK